MPRKKVDEVQPGSVPLDDEPTESKAKPGGKKIGNKSKGGRPRKEQEPRSHHAKPGPSLDQVKAGLALVGGLAQQGARMLTTNKETGASPVDRVVLSEDELARVSAIAADRLMKITPVARGFVMVSQVSKASPLVREAMQIAAPRLARLGLLPPMIAKMLGVPDEDISAGVIYRRDRADADRAKRQARPMQVPKDRTSPTRGVDPRDRVAPTEDRNTSGTGLPNVGTPPEAYERVETSYVEPHAPRGSGGMDSLTEPPR
jgi:hypothetical protein